jgi:signal transduction histidine kinase
MLAATPPPGSHLAKASPVADEAISERWWSGSIGAAMHRRIRSRPLLMASFSLVGSSFAIGLWLTGYPRWRVAAVVAATAIQGLILVGVPRARSAGRAHRDEVESVVGTVVTVAMTWITGGLRSPLLLVALLPIMPILIRFGAGRFTLAACAFPALAGVAMAVVPPSWVGPPIEPRLQAASTLGFLLLAVIFTVDYVAELVRTLRTALTEMVRAREEAATQALERARDLELLSSKLSHELKNPLGAVKALVQLSVRATADAEQKERLSVVESEVEHLHAILKGYLSFSRPIESLHVQPLALGEVIDDVLALLDARATAAGVRLEREGDAHLQADPRRIKEALFNLVANAVEATPRKGEVVATLCERDGVVEVTIRDTGRGMSPETLARVGTPFFTTREQGTGLGVLLARSVFTQHGGSLVFDSAPGMGTTATGRLPIVPRKESLDGPRAAGG